MDNRMSDEQFKKHAEFEETHDCTAISPNLLEQLNGKVKSKQQFFYVVLQNQNGKIIAINHYDNYETALMQGMNKAKETYAQWSVFDLGGRFIDGNFNGR